MDLRFADGLVKNRRGVLTLLKRLRRQLSARVTVDAGRVDKEVPVNIGWEFLFKICHGSPYTAPLPAGEGCDREVGPFTMLR